MDVKHSDKVLLTGGSGLVGRRVATRLREYCELTHFDLANPGDGLRWIQGSLCDAEAVAAACAGQDSVVHMAALHGRRWEAVGDHVGFEVNVVGTHNVLEGARQAGARRVVFTSSIWATGHPPVPAPYLPVDEDLPRQPSELYGLTKALGEQMCRFASDRHGVSTICLRPGGILPDGESLSRRFGLLFGCVDVRDVAEAHVLALNAPPDVCHESFVITADSALCGIDPEQYCQDPVGVLEGIFPGIEDLVQRGELSIEGAREWYSIEKARRLLGYSPLYAFGMPAG